MSTERIVIVGAGLAGGNAAVELREQGFSGPVTVLGAEQHPPYERPPLSKGMLLGEEDAADTLVEPDAWWAEHDVDLRTGVEVAGIDTAARQVQLADGPLEYASLILATGSEPRTLPALAEAGIASTPLRTLEQSRRIVDALRPGAKVAIVGAGWIGLEVAAAARNAEAQVSVFEQAPLPLLGVLGPEVASLFADLHRAHDVDLRLGTAVSPQELAGHDLVVVGIGAAPRTGLAEAAGLGVSNGVLVDEQLRTGDPHVLAAGDIANHLHPRFGRIRVEHWDNAREQGRVAARNALAGPGAGEVYDRVPYFFTDQYDLGMEYVGHVGAEGYDRVDLEGDTDLAAGGALRAFWVRDGEVVAAMQANDWDYSEELRSVVGSRR